MRSFGISLIAITLLLSGCSGSAPAPEEKTEEKAPAAPASTFVSDPELKELMAGTIELNAETIWNIALDENAPKTDGDWKTFDDAAVLLESAGKSIMTSPLAKDQGQWKEESQKLVDTGGLLRAAVKAKNRDAVIEAGNKMNDDVCVSCHKLYFNPAP